MIQKRVFFEWATGYLAQHRGEKWTADAFGKGFKLSDPDWASLKKIMDNRKVAVDSVWTTDRPFMTQQIRAELASATFGSLERYRILVEDDPQILSAIDLFPQASKLLAGNLDPIGDKNGKPGNRKTPATANAPKTTDR